MLDAKRRRTGRRIPSPAGNRACKAIYASLMIADDVPLVVVSKQLGHTQTSTTSDIYSHLIASSQVKAMQTLDRFNDILVPPEQEPEKKPGDNITEIKKAVGG